VRLRLVDVAGRAVLARDWVELPGGVSRFSWAGVDEGGRSVPGGIYFARLEDRAGVRSARIVLLR
jgi:hypothetical protein